MCVYEMLVYGNRKECKIIRVVFYLGSCMWIGGIGKDKYMGQKMRMFRVLR